jgi:hypothetical protein
MNKQTRQNTSMAVEEDLLQADLPFTVPSRLEGLEELTEILVLRLSVLQLNMTRRVLRYDYESALEVSAAAPRCLVRCVLDLDTMLIVPA